MTSPVLLTAFNRPAETARVLEAVRQYAPRQLYLAVDGPRSGRADDRTGRADVLRVLDTVDWDCRVERLVREENRGCRGSMEEAIDWFFDSVPEGIILEDDCLPDLDFFRFCDALLDRYRHDDRVAMVSGANVLGEWRATEHSYFFGHGAVWGWASWRRAWRRSAQHLDGLTSSQARGRAEHTLGAARWRRLEPQLQAVASGVLDTWDYPWVFSFAARGQVAVLPAANLVTNIGFGPEATHTSSTDSALASLPLRSLQWPLRHPSEVVFDREFDRRWLALEAADRGLLARLGHGLPQPVRAALHSWRARAKRR